MRPIPNISASDTYKDFLEANKEEVLRSAVKAIDPDLMKMDRQQALTLAGAMKNSGFTREDFAAVMSKSQHDKGTFADQWERFKGKGVHGSCTEGTIYQYAKLCGWTWPAPGRSAKRKPDMKSKKPELYMVKWEDSYTVSCLMDSVEYKQKPIKVGEIRNRERVPTPPPTMFPVDEFARRVTKGCTFYPTVYSKEYAGLTNKGKPIYNYRVISQQLFVVDIDNEEEYKDEDGKRSKRRIKNPLSIADALNICKKHGMYPFFVYETFSSKFHRDDPEEPYSKFRLCFSTNEPIMAQEVGERGISAVTNFFINLFGSAADPRTTDPARLIYGTDEHDRAKLYHKFLDKTKLLSLVLDSAESASCKDPPEKDGASNDSDKDYEFYRINKYGEPSSVIDSAVVGYMKQNVEMFLYNDMLYIYDHGVYSIDEKGNRFKTIVSKLLYPEFVTATKLDNIFKLLKTDIDLEIEESDLNNHPPYVINVKNGMLNLKTLELKEHNARLYHSINQIPHEYIPGFNYDGTVTEEFLTELFPDQDDMIMFLEYSGYCMTKDTSQQKFLIIKGPGATGKSELIHLVEGTIGPENTSALSIQNTNDRFSPVFLLGKLLNANADISSELMNDISGLKKLIGEDTMRGEYKGGKMFSFKPYVKLLFSANRIPESKDDKTNAYFRRMMILEVNKRCKEIPRLSERLREETKQGVFFHMAVQAARNMYLREGPILESENSRAAVQRLYEATDSVMAFLRTAMIKDPSSRVEREVLYKLYRYYCWCNEREPKKKNGFYENIRDKGFHEMKSNGIRFFEGIRNVFNVNAVERAYQNNETIEWHVEPGEYGSF